PGRRPRQKLSGVGVPRGWNCNALLSWLTCADLGLPPGWFELCFEHRRDLVFRQRLAEQESLRGVAPGFDEHRFRQPVLQPFGHDTQSEVVAKTYGRTHDGPRVWIGREAGHE